MEKKRISILEAVQEAIGQDISLGNAITGGIWTGEIPENSVMPYGSLEIDSTSFEFASIPPDLERTRFSIVLFAKGAGTIDDLLDHLQSFLSTTNYTFSNDDYLVYLFPERRTTRSEFTRDKEGNQIFTGAAMFEAAIFRH